MITNEGSLNNVILVMFLFQVRLILKFSFIKDTFFRAKQFFQILDHL